MTRRTAGSWAGGARPSVRPRPAARLAPGPPEACARSTAHAPLATATPTPVTAVFAHSVPHRRHENEILAKFRIGFIRKAKEEMWETCLHMVCGMIYLKGL